MSMIFCSDTRDFRRTSGRRNAPGARSPMQRRIPLLLCTALLTAILLLTGHSAVFAAIIDEPMTGATAPGWILGGTPTAAILTGDGSIDPAGDGWLRLTDTGTNQAGYAYLDTPFSITSGVVIQYDYTTWGGDGADGYSIFLFDAATTPFQIGASGGSLGYAQKTVAPVSPGLSGGYVGIGIDEWGNFSSPTEGRVGGPGQRPNSVAVRGTASTSWAYLGGSAANVGQLWFNQGTRPLQLGTQYRKVVIYLTPVPAPNYLRVDVYLQFGYNQPLTPAATGIYTGRSIPANVKIGYAASTGGSTNYHEIRNLLINPLQTDINLAIYKSTPAIDVNAGDTVTYTVTARNYGPNPAITATNAPITDIVPAELTGVTWTCAGSSGATCGTASGSGNSINTTATLPFNSAVVYTISGTVSGAPTDNPFTNTATIAAPAGVADYYLADNSASASVNIRTSNLATSSKTVVDRNGGIVDPGDVLRYTVTLNETAGVAASGISVTDDIPGNVNSFSIVALPAGAGNSSTFSGTGGNGNGFLNITGIAVPAGGSVDIVFDVTINSGAPAGTTIDNSATVINPLGPGATPAAPQVTVNDSSSPISGTKLLYLYDGGSYDLSRTPTNSTNRITINRNASRVWSQNPAAAEDITIDPAVNSTVPVFLVLRRDSNSGNRTVQVDLQCSSGGGTVLTDTRTVYLTGTRQEIQFDLTTALPPWTTPITCSAGNRWELTVTNTNASVNDPMRVYFARDEGTSRVELPATTIINVDNITLYDAAYPAGNLLTSAAPGQTVYVRATVSDPFGSFDISGAALTLTNPSGTIRVNGTAMTEVNDDGNALKIYESAYTIPLGDPTGTWSVKVEADEGSEGTVSDIGTRTFTVAPVSNLSTSTKTVSDLNGGDVELGDELRYTLTLHETGGIAASGVSATDIIPANVTDFTIVTPLPPGAGNFSTLDGTGANGSGFLDIRNLAVSAGGTISISYTVKVSGPDGGTIANSAAIANPGGPGANPSAPTLTIAGGSVAGSGNKPLYLYNSTSTPAYKLSRTPMTGNPAYVNIWRNFPRTWTLDPVLQSPVTISSGTIPMELWLSTNSNDTYNISATLLCGTDTVSTASQNESLVVGGAVQRFFDLPLAADYTCPAGNALALSLNHNGGGWSIYIFPKPPGGTSNVTLPSQNVINVNNSDITIFTAAYPGGASVATANPGDDIYIRATVSDPFGSYDISGSTLTLTDPLGTVMLGAPAVAMTEVFDSNAATKIYEYGPYTVPAGGPGGNWAARVEATEGTEGTVSNYGIGTLEVAELLPLLTVVKSANSGSADPGAVVIYTIQVINTGAGPATAVILDDHLSPYSALGIDSYGAGLPFQFIEGSPASGLTLGTPDYSSNDGSSYGYVPSAGYDGNVTNWKIPMSGTMNAGGGRFTLRYQVQIK